ncbi:hypothetical protein K502DRAFT_343165 [Neoconidiobolus thromboides FSU 785]|nr:hypothetical protein K502DRAFT_343165 [Neoconidiobolus thromboides FSU 785]
MSDNEKQLKYRNNGSTSNYNFEADNLSREEENLSNSESMEGSEKKSNMKTSISLSSMDSYASSIIQLSDRRNSIFSSVPSINSPDEKETINLDMTQSISLDEGIPSDSMSHALHTSLPETAALARLTCQQVDEMMSLVLQMIRRMDMLDERVDALLPTITEKENHDKEEENSSTFSWVKGLTLAAIPILLAVSVNYFYGNKKRRR